MKKFMQKIIFLLMGILVIVAFLAIYFDSQRNNMINSLSAISISTFLYLILLRFGFQTVNGLILRVISARFGIGLAFKEWFGLPFITAMGNYITPFSGGMVARASYLKFRHAFPYTQFASTLAASYLVFFWAAGVIGIIIVAISLAGIGSYWKIVYFLSFVVLVLTILLVLPLKRVPGNNWLSQMVNSSLDGWNLIKNDYLLLTKLLSYSCINILLNGFSFWIAYNTFAGSSLPFGKIFLISLILIFSGLIKITPGNLGVFEGMVSLGSGLLGIGAGIGLMVSLLVRVAGLIPAFSLGTVFSLVLARELTNSNMTDESNQRIE